MRKGQKIEKCEIVVTDSIGEFIRDPKDRKLYEKHEKFQTFFSLALYLAENAGKEMSGEMMATRVNLLQLLSIVKINRPMNNRQL